MFGRGGSGGGIRNGVPMSWGRSLTSNVSLYVGGCSLMGASGLYGSLGANCLPWKPGVTPLCGAYDVPGSSVYLVNPK